MPRLFTGLEIPSAVTQRLATLRTGMFGARFIEPDDYHITLRFIGDIDARLADDIAGALEGVRRKPFPITLRGLGVFGKDRPNAIHVEVEPNRALEELAAEHERLMRRYGLEPETRKYIPHVTIARVRGAHPGDVASWMVSHSPFSLPPFEVDRFNLYSSRDSVGGGPYILEASYPLRG